MNIKVKHYTVPVLPFPFFACNKQTKQIILVTGPGKNQDCYAGMLVTDGEVPCESPAFSYTADYWLVEHFTKFVGELVIECS